MNSILDYLELLNDDMMLIVLGSLIIVIFLIYIINKDNVTTKKLKDYEFAIEDINRHIHMLEKKLETDKNQAKIQINSEMQKTMAKELNDIADALMMSIRELQSTQESIKNNLQDRIGRIEEKTKEYMSVPQAASLDENRVLSLFKAGYSKEDIAKELHANVSEVSFILSISNLTRQQS